MNKGPSLLLSKTLSMVVYIPVIPALRGKREDNDEFQTSLGFTTRPPSQNNNKKSIKGKHVELGTVAHTYNPNTE